MSLAVFSNVYRMIGEHARRFSLPAVDLVFHGGEPLLLGHGQLAEYARLARESLAPITKVRLGMQTNGMLLDDEFLRICDRWDIRIGVSVDGSEDGHDRHQRDRRGIGSYRWVAAGLAILTADNRRHLFSASCVRSTWRTTR